jgi:hypothetical protein
VFTRVVSLCYSQNQIETLIAQGISYVSKPLPSESIRIDRTLYEKGFFRFQVINGEVIFSLFSVGCESIREAQLFLSGFYDFFENNNWILLHDSDDGEIYLKNNIHVLISVPFKREDGKIAAQIAFYK